MKEKYFIRVFSSVILIMFVFVFFCGSDDDAIIYPDDTTTQSTTIVTTMITSTTEFTTQSTTTLQPLTNKWSKAWTCGISAPCFGGASSGDIDNDNKAEVVFGTYFNDGNVYALNGEDGSLLWKFLDQAPVDCSLKLFDIFNSGRLDVIVAMSSDFDIYALNGITGSSLWNSTMQSSTDAPPSIADVDADGSPEVIQPDMAGAITVYDIQTGNVEKTFGPLDNTVQTAASVLNVDTDPELEIIVATWFAYGQSDYGIFCFDYTTGTSQWHYPLSSTTETGNFHIYHAGAFADIDNDTKPEIVFGCYDSYIHCLNAEDGSVKWKYLISNEYPFGPPAIADINNDGNLEVIAVANSVVAISSTGSKLWSYPTDSMQQVARGVSIADIDGNNSLDIIFGEGSGKLKVLNNLGNLVWSFDTSSDLGKTDSEVDTSVVISDLTGDGYLDMFFIAGHGESTDPTKNWGVAYCINGGGGTGKEWTMFGHDYHHSNNYHEDQLYY